MMMGRHDIRNLRPAQQSESRVITFHPHMVGRKRERGGRGCSLQNIKSCPPAMMFFFCKDPPSKGSINSPNSTTTGGQVLKYMSLWRAFHVQVTTGVDILQHPKLSVLGDCKKIKTSLCLGSYGERPTAGLITVVRILTIEQAPREVRT